MKKIIITGVTGQDGSHMCDYLIKKFKETKESYRIYGAVRRLSVLNHKNIEHLEPESNFELIDMDLNDAHSIRDVIIDIDIISLSFDYLSLGFYREIIIFNFICGILNIVF